MGSTFDAAGKIIPDYPWLNKAILVAILAGYSSVILVMLMGQSRVFFSMSKDGLLPKVFSDVHPKFKTPWKSNLLFMVFVGLFAGFGRISLSGTTTIHLVGSVGFTGTCGLYGFLGARRAR